MPEYLAPHVYIEETSFRNKTIEGVSTSTAGFVGPARFGPINGIPELLTSLADYERIYGSIDPLQLSGVEVPNHLAHGVRNFFDNGGKRLYVTRIWNGTGGIASATVNPPLSPPSSASAIQLTARYPGGGGNVDVTFTLRVGQNVLVTSTPPALRGVKPHDIVLVNAGAGTLVGAQLYRAFRPVGATQWQFFDDTETRVRDLAATDTSVRVLTVSVQVAFPPPQPRPGAIRSETWDELSFHPRHERALSRFFGRTLANRMLSLTVPFYIDDTATSPPGSEHALNTATVLAQLATKDPSEDIWRFTTTLSGGHDGNQPTASDYEGSDSTPKTGLKTFEDIADISIVAAPGSTPDLTTGRAVALELIEHVERMRYRIAVLDAPPAQALSGIRAYRAVFDSRHAALYYPWVTVIDPVTNDELNLPPSGFVAGIYARNDIEKGVHKAPANETVANAVGFEFSLNKAQQDVLNPEGINCFRFFEGRGHRLWGARLASSDPEWKYVNLRRYFAYLERSIERGTQWVVFENNSESLWANVSSTVEDFLFNEWKSGRLLGARSDEAFFVKCDRSTMTQNDLDNGRLICLIGVAPVRPAEFVIFRIGQWTGSARQ